MHKLYCEILTNYQLFPHLVSRQTLLISSEEMKKKKKTHNDNRFIKPVITYASRYMIECI